jgi:small conductance mechanosensitive channel
MWHQWLEHFRMEALIEKSAHIVSGAILAVIIFGLFWITALIVGGVLHRVARRAGAGRQDVLLLVAQTVKVGIYVLGVVSALGTAGVNVSALVASLGLTGFALGFAFKDALSNLLAGALILFYRPFARGSRIMITNFEGEVESIDLRYTRLKDGETHFLVPNATLLSNVITVKKL